MCNKCEQCLHNVVYGPGDDDYGRDNFEEDWECPGCHKKSKFTRRAIRMGIWKCPQCEWISEDAKQFDETMARIIKKHSDKQKDARNEIIQRNFSSRIRERVHQLIGDNDGSNK